ncbi:UNKNOWN [Stylonychia lemnae]|uniref:Uncharacterized protein n=1 Tax=Stylonychia lemnae TaxID=5949 RepID=A0A077ZTT0_STYLE|nr:UNKNOWN [Stylonychia lemnae]|eukprot:CDW71846.1 UNKNOWN [Stylonychia lemnae]
MGQLQNCYDWHFPKSFGNSSGNSSPTEFDIDGEQNIIIGGVSSSVVRSAIKIVFQYFSSSSQTEDWARYFNFEQNPTIPPQVLGIKFQDRAQHSMKALALLSNQVNGYIFIVLLNIQDGSLYKVYRDSQQNEVLFNNLFSNSGLLNKRDQVFMHLTNITQRLRIITKLDFSNTQSILSPVWAFDYQGSNLIQDQFFAFTQDPNEQFLYVSHSVINVTTQFQSYLHILGIIKLNQTNGKSIWNHGFSYLNTTRDPNQLIRELKVYEDNQSEIIVGAVDIYQYSSNYKQLFFILQVSKSTNQPIWKILESKNTFYKLLDIY